MNDIEIDTLINIITLLAPLPTSSQVRLMRLLGRATLQHVRNTFAELQRQTANGAVDRREALAFLELLDLLMSEEA